MVHPSFISRNRNRIRIRYSDCIGISVGGHIREQLVPGNWKGDYTMHRFPD
jgi:hypothetical protein